MTDLILISPIWPTNALLRHEHPQNPHIDVLAIILRKSLFQTKQKCIFIAFISFPMIFFLLAQTNSAD